MAPAYRRPDAWRSRDAAGYVWIYWDHYPDVAQEHEIESLYSAAFVAELLGKVSLLEKQLANVKQIVGEVMHDMRDVATSRSETA